MDNNKKKFEETMNKLAKVKKDEVNHDVSKYIVSKKSSKKSKKSVVLRPA
ncbi:MAG: hypothetical protein LBD46_07905 [Endomicrobium sp.]|jgi:hypothetical protein|nr:hypothetical protein [Endomicrobium sp.]